MNDSKLWKAFSEYIRLRDAEPYTGLVKCFTCHRIKHWKEVDCGHGIGRQHKATKYNEQNNHAQCKHCNGFEGGKREVYKKEMDKRYGVGAWDKMEIQSRQIVKIGKFEINIMTEFYRKQVLELKIQKKL